MSILLVGAIAPPVTGKVSAGCFPFGALAVGSYLRQQKIKCEVVSTGFPSSGKVIAEKLRTCRMLGISTMTGYYLKYAIAVVKAMRKLNPRKLIVWGGPHASLMPDELIREGLADVVIRGAGERAMMDIASGKFFADIPGASYLNGCDIKHNPAAERGEKN